MIISRWYCSNRILASESGRPRGSVLLICGTAVSDLTDEGPAAEDGRELLLDE